MWVTSSHHLPSRLHNTYFCQGCLKQRWIRLQGHLSKPNFSTCLNRWLHPKISETSRLDIRHSYPNLGRLKGDIELYLHALGLAAQPRHQFDKELWCCCGKWQAYAFLGDLSWHHRHPRLHVIHYWPQCSTLLLLGHGVWHRLVTIAKPNNFELCPNDLVVL